MPRGATSAAPAPGRRLQRRILIALTVSSGLPILVLSYVVVDHLSTGGHPIDAFAIPALLFFTTLGVAMGAWVLWDLGRAVTQMRGMLNDDTAPPTSAGSPADEVRTVMETFGRLQRTIEEQAAEINTFAARLDAAYRDLEATNARLEEFSFKDEVTGLYNRRFFSVRLEEEISRFRRFNHPVSVVLIDLDGFKAVNDELGHAVGDETLRDIGQVLMRHSRGINVVSRYGGDEFVVLLVETSQAGARLYADRIRKFIESYPFGHGKRITASFGVANLPEDDVATSEDLMKAADQALYAAKRSGKNRVAIAIPTPGEP